MIPITKRKPRIVYEVNYGDETMGDCGMVCDWGEEKIFTNATDAKLFLHKIKNKCFEWVLYVHMYTGFKGKEHQSIIAMGCSESFPLLDVFEAYERTNQC